MALLARMKIQFLILLSIPKMIVSIGLAHEEIIQWWTKMSLQKPIKCQVNQNYMTAFHPIAEKFLSQVEPIPIITSKPCPCFKDDKKVFCV